MWRSGWPLINRQPQTAIVATLKRVMQEWPSHSITIPMRPHQTPKHLLNRSIAPPANRNRLLMMRSSKPYATDAGIRQSNRSTADSPVLPANSSPQLPVIPPAPASMLEEWRAALALANTGPDATFDNISSSDAAAAASSAPQEDAEAAAVASASMAAFAKMEAQMRSRQRQREREATTGAAADAATSPVVTPANSSNAASAPPSSASSNSWRVEPEALPLVAPREPGPGECCGRDCPNCVWIRYSEDLAKYDDAVAVRAAQHIGVNSEPTPSPTVSTNNALPPAPVRELTRFERAMQRERDAMLLSRPPIR